MSMDRSLKSKDTLERHRNVLSRAERITVLKETDRWEEGRRASGLPKVAHRKAAVGKKEKADKTAEGEAAAAPGTAPVAGAAPAAAPAADKKGDKKAAEKKPEKKK
ncbi:MAG: small basic protein [Planctomycetes bacterium]|nr:small basic protein [Planctomycetota bacterium]MBI3836151.1 small basic protein [Planctomycetota bacterium]